MKVKLWLARAPRVRRSCAPGGSHSESLGNVGALQCGFTFRFELAEVLEAQHGRGTVRLWASRLAVSIP